MEVTLGLLHRLRLVAQAQGRVLPVCTYVMVIEALRLLEKVTLICLLMGSEVRIPDMWLFQGVMVRHCVVVAFGMARVSGRFDLFA